MEKYKIVKNKLELDKFINWLPDLGREECFYVAILIRRKYVKELSIPSDASLIKRFVCTKETLERRLRESEIELGGYVIKGVTIPQEAISVYITINPRSHVIAGKNLLIELARLVTSEYTGYKVDKLALDTLHNSGSKNKLMDFDFDNVDVLDTITSIKDQNLINVDALTIIKTHGGFHLIVDTNKIEKDYQKRWFQGISKLEGVDVKPKDVPDGVETRQGSLTPIPGTTQGNFSPYIYELNN